MNNDNKPQENNKVKLSLWTAGWYATFALIPFGTSALGLLVLLIAKIKEFFHQTSTNKLSIKAPPLVNITRKLFFVFLGIILLSALLSTRKDIALLSSLGFILMTYVFIFGGQELSRSGDLLRKKYIPVLIVSTILATSISIFRYYLQHLDRLMNIFAGANGFGTILIVVSGLTIGYLNWRGGRWRYLLFPFLSLVLPTLLLTKSRGGWAGFAIMLSSFVFFTRKMFLIFLIIVLIIGTVFIVSPPLKDRLISAFTIEQNNNRVFIWQSTLRMIADHPILGVGAGVYPFVFDKYAMPGSTERGVSFAHNLFLQVTAELGFLGLLIFCIILGLILFMSFKLARLGNPFYQGIFTALIGILIHQQVDLPIWGIDIGGAFWALVGIIIGFYQYECLSGNIQKIKKTKGMDIV